MLKLSQPITAINGFRIGDTVRLKDGDGRPHIIKAFVIDGLKEFFFVVQFEDGTETMLSNISFLELKESEDEKIRKVLVYFIQKEKEYMESKVKPENSPELMFLMDALAYLERRKEQKPALTPERLRPKFAVGDTICRPMYCDHTVREIYVRCNDPVYVCVTDEGLESHISFSEQDEWERKEQKPVKLDDDTEVGLDRALQIVKAAKGNLCGYQSNDGI